MKRIVFSVLLLLALTGCKKMMDKPDFPREPTVITTPSSPEDIELVTSLKVTPVTFNPKEQDIVASIDGTQLNLVYNEKVQLLIDATRFKSAWYIVFKEDFSDTQFSDFDFTTVLAWGAIAKNWMPDNLKQMEHSETDTTIAGVKVVNVKFKRTFKFYKKYETTAEATDKMTAIMGKKETVKFLTRYQPDADTTRFDVTTVNVIYKK